jgi:hypothetical protein
MPAAPPGQVTSTLRDSTGAVLLEYTSRWDPITDVMLSLSVVNNTGVAVSVLAWTEATGTRRFNVPVGPTLVTAAQLLTQGIRTHADMGDLTVELAAPRVDPPAP